MSDQEKLLVEDTMLLGTGFGFISTVDGALSLKRLRAEDVLDPVPALEAEIARLREALHQCAEYFDDRADVDTSDGEPVANKEMRLLGEVQTALGEK